MIGEQLKDGYNSQGLTNMDLILSQLGVSGGDGDFELWKVAQSLSFDQPQDPQMFIEAARRSNFSFTVEPVARIVGIMVDACN